MRRVMIGEMLLHGGSIDELMLGTALRHQRDFGGRLGEILVGLGFLTEAQLVDALGCQLRVRVVDLSHRTVPPAILRLVPEALLRRHGAFPVGVLPERAGGRPYLHLALGDPQDVAAIDELQFAAGMPVRAVLAGRRDIAQALARHFGGAAPAEPARRREALDLRLPEPSAEPMLLVDFHDDRSFRRVGT